MALNKLGYREWNGTRTTGAMRWSVITETAVKSAWKSMWVRRLIFMAFLPMFWLATGFFLYEQALNNDSWRHLANQMLGSIELVPGQMNDLHHNQLISEDSRHYVWSTFLSMYLSSTQSLVMVLLVGLITPPMISQDFRSRAFLLYFSRPMGRVEYLIGKSASVWFYLGLISLVPACLVFVLGILLSPRIEVLLSTWDLPIRILIASLFLSIPTTALALSFSSMTQESRFASFAWFVLWVIGSLSYAIIQGAIQATQFDQNLQTNWYLISPYHTLQKIQLWVFGFYNFNDVILPLMIVLLVTVIAYGVAFRRISAPMRA